MTSVGARLQALESRGLRRRLTRARGVDLSSNDYLGLASDPVVREALRGALDEGGPHGSTGSRLLSGNDPRFEALESEFAAWQGREAALYFSTGYAANVGMVSALVQAGDVVVSDALNHASLVDGVRLSRGERRIVPHLDLDAFAQAVSGSSPGQCWVLVESVYSMDGDLAPLAELADLCDRAGANLVVDEAHATGLFGTNGAGRVSEAGLQHRVFATVHPCGKALGMSLTYAHLGSCRKEEHPLRQKGAGQR
ncbi:MAG: aminotransferase class I/II-fold pyridoxal phosphate-dependent enzyme, partial [Myxococcota bacterium]|nr:aminotransferase class I/II-fold pyridoxal phosphate-dependent enzyme [Myxococcota bacterium]